MCDADTTAGENFVADVVADDEEVALYMSAFTPMGVDSADEQRKTPRGVRLSDAEIFRKAMCPAIGAAEVLKPCGGNVCPYDGGDIECTCRRRIMVSSGRWLEDMLKARNTLCKPDAGGKFPKTAVSFFLNCICLCGAFLRRC
jgi:hypothetical protein